MDKSEWKNPMEVIEPGKQRDGQRMRAVLVLAATVGFVTSPLWSAGFGGYEPDAFPVPLDDPPTQPAGYAFGIWAIIYLWLLVSAGFGLFFRAEDASWDAGRWWLISSLVLGTPWISVAALSPVWATVLIIGMLFTSLRAVFLSPLNDRWALRLPLALYAGWLTAATGVSLSLLVVGYGAVVPWAVIVLLLSLAGGLVVQFRLVKAPTYGLALGWALIGVAVTNLSSGNIFTTVLVIVLTALVFLAAVRSEVRPG